MEPARRSTTYSEPVPDDPPMPDHESGSEELVAEAARSLPGWLVVKATAGSVPTELEEGTKLSMWLQVAEARALVTLPTGSRMLVTEEEIVVQASPNASFTEVSYLMYSMGTRLVLSLRRQFSLHASAFMWSGFAVALIGQSMAGKSTALLGLRNRGFQPVVDDLLAVRLDEDQPLALCSGWRRPVHVRTETASAMPEWQDSPVLDPEVRWDQPRLAAAVTEDVCNVPLVCAIQLHVRSDAEAVTVEPLVGAMKLQVIKNTVDEFGQSSFGGRDVEFFTWASGVADRVPMYRITRPRSGWSLEQVLDEIEAVLSHQDVQTE
jgi:hypothetical protein